MKKNLLKSMLAVALLSFGCMNALAEDVVETAPVKMTYVSGSDADVDVAYGECDTIKAGWNRGDLVAVGNTIVFGNKSWGANWIGVLQADASAIPGTIQKATLKAKVSGSLDNKRPTVWGVALTDNVWSAELNYSSVGTWTVSALLNGGEQVWTSSANSTVFEEHEWDITEAFAGGKSIATILVYEGVKANNGGAAGGFMTEAEVVVEYEPFEATSKTYTFDGDEAVIPFKNGTNTGNGRITAAIENDKTLNSNVLGWTCAGNAGNGYSFSYYDFTELLNNPALVKVEFDYYNTKGGRAVMTISDAMVRGTDGHCEKGTYKSNGAIFRIGSAKTGDANEAFINDIMLKQDDETISTPLIDDETGEEIGNIDFVQPGLCNKWMHVVVMVNNDARTVAWVVTDMEGELIHYGSDKFYSDDANACSQIDLFGYINNSHCAMIDNLEITNYKSNAVFADYTVKYVDAQGNELKESRTGNGQVGKPVKLLDSDMTAIVVDGQKYIYESDNTAEVVIEEEGTTILVKFRNADKYYIAVTLKTTDGTTLQTVRNDDLWVWEGDTYTYYPPRGIEKDEKYYFCPSTVTDNKGNPTNGTTLSLDPSVKEPKWNSSLERYYIMETKNDYSVVDSVAYYSDFERLALPVEDEGNGTGLGLLVGTVNNWWSFSNGYFERFAGGRGIRLDEGSYVYTEPIAEAGTYKLTIYGRNDKSAACENPYVLGYIDADGNKFLYTALTIPEWGSATTGENIVEGVAIPAGAKLLVMNDDAAKQISLDDISMTKTGDFVAPAVISLEKKELQEAIADAEAVSTEGKSAEAVAAFNTALEAAQAIMAKADATAEEIEQATEALEQAIAGLITDGIASVNVNGQKNGVIYNLAGQAVKAAQKGLYIRNGKKFVVK